MVPGHDPQKVIDQPGIELASRLLSEDGLHPLEIRGPTVPPFRSQAIVGVRDAGHLAGWV
jgi:hypothetical protein